MKSFFLYILPSSIANQQLLKLDTSLTRNWTWISMHHLMKFDPDWSSWTVRVNRNSKKFFFLVGNTYFDSFVHFERESSISVCLAAIGLRREKFVWRFLFGKKWNNEFAWNLVFSMELWLRNHWKCCRSV